MFEFLKTMGPLKFGMFYIVMLILMGDLGNGKERKVYSLINDMSVCRVDKGSIVLVRFRQCDSNVDS